MATTTTTKLQRFKEAMQLVYGPFEGLTQADAERWTPPDKPGAGGHQGRYLWTDAFGVVNFITLYRETESGSYLTLAKRLVQTVHDVLGRTRDGTARLPGATDEHPLKGGLRIGKVDAAGNDGDGQYHHYLTLWMFALNRLALTTGEKVYNAQAIELAKAVHPHFVMRKSSGRLGMVWKVSMDLKTVLVPSEGHLDPANGYVICRLLEQTDKKFGGGSPSLETEIDEYHQIMSREGKTTASHDLLDLGMGLWMCQLVRDQAWAAKLGKESVETAESVLAEGRGILARDPSRRLAFREFGTCLGIQCYGASDYLASRVASIVAFWEKYLEDSMDEDLRPISLVMYAAALVPGAWQEGYL